MTDESPVQTADQEVAITRVFDAPRELVFRAWTDPDQVARWWGPEGFDTPRESVKIELRVGGRFELDMVVASPEIAAGMGVEVGTAFPERAEIVELAEPELLVMRSEAQPQIGLPVETLTRIEFHADGDRTRVVATSGPYTAAMASNSEIGWNQSFDKLDQLLAATA